MPAEEVRVRLRRKLEEAFGAEEASILMDRPPGGWTDLVTNQMLDVKIDALRAELRGEMTELRGEIAELRGEFRAEIAGVRREMAELNASVDRRLRHQTIVMTTTLIAGITLSATLSHV
jgi:hypothetical protein